jgi:hypothetical protein
MGSFIECFPGISQDQTQVDAQMDQQEYDQKETCQ